MNLDAAIAYLENEIERHDRLSERRAEVTNQNEAILAIARAVQKLSCEHEWEFMVGSNVTACNKCYRVQP